MSSFDIDSYLSNRADADSKLKQLADASRQKVAELSAIKTQSEPVKQSWSDQLGLSDGGFLSNRVNDVASIVSGTGRLAGQIASLPTNVASVVATDGLLPGDYEAYNRTQTGQSTPADLSRLNRESAPGMGSVLNRFRSAEALRGTSRSINNAFDVTSIVDQSNRDALANDLKVGFEPAWGQVTKGWGSGKPMEVVSGLASIFASAGSAIPSNPSAVREYALENAPQLFVGLLGKAGQGAMAASNIGYAADTFQKGMENYAKANGGQLPPEAMRNDMAMKAASLALAEQAGDYAGLAATKLLGKEAKDIATGAAQDATRTGFKNALFNVGTATGKGFASEAPTEAYQTYMEGEITGKPASALDIYTGAVIGGASGGALSGGGRLAQQLLTPSIPLTPEQLLEKANSAKASKAEQDSFKAATDANDPTVYADPASPTYDPGKAVGVLLRHVQGGKATEEVKQANLEQAHSIVNGLEDRFNDGTYALEKAKGTPAELEAIKQELATDKADFAALTPEGIKAGGAAYQASIAMNESILALAADPRAMRAKEIELVALNKQFLRAQGPRDALAKMVQLKPENLAAQVDLADAAVDPADTAGQAQAQQAIKRVLNFSMAAPKGLSDESIKRLAENLGNGLTLTQRTYLRQFSAARIAQNLLKDGDIVQNEILNGDKSKGQMGIKDYNSEIGAAITAKSGKTARKLIEQLTKFSEDHAGKQAAVEDAIAQATQAGPGVFFKVISDGKRGWSVEPGKFAEGERAKNGGLDINSNSGNLLAKIVVASAALTATVAKQEAAYALVFDKQPAVVAAPPKVVAPVTSTDTPAPPVQKPAVIEQVAPVVAPAAAQATEPPKTKEQEAPAKVVAEKTTDVGMPEFAPFDEGSDQGAPFYEFSSWNEEDTNESPEERAVSMLSGTTINGADTPNTFRVLNKTERALLDKAIARLQDMFLTELKAFPFVVEEGQQYGYPATFYSGERAIALNPATFTASVFGMSAEDSLYATLAHELAHGRDFLLGDVSNEVATLQEGGTTYEEVRAVVNMAAALPKETKATDPAWHLYDWFAYVMVNPAADRNVPAELFAQLHALYITQPELMREHLPETYTDYENTYGLDGKSVERVSSRNDGQGSTGTGQQSTRKNDQGKGNEDSATQDGENTAEVVFTPTLVEGGALSLFKNVAKAAKGAAYQAKNLIREYLVQQKENDKNASNRPLVAVKYFLSHLQDPQSAVTVGDYLAGGTVTPEQTNLLNMFFELSREWSDILQGDLKVPTSKDFQYRDMSSFLVNQDDAGNLEMDENTLTALVYTAINGIMDLNGKLYNDDAAINGLLGRSKEAHVPWAGVKDVLGTIGQRANMIQNSWGGNATDALGLKATPDAPLDLMPRLESAMGARAVKLLIDLGIVERAFVSPEQMKAIREAIRVSEGTQDDDMAPDVADLTDDITNDSDFRVNTFLRLVRNEDKSLPAKTQAIVDAFAGTQGVLDKLFSVEGQVKYPSFVPIVYKQATSKAGMEVPSTITDAINKKQTEPYYAKQDSWKVLSQLSDKAGFAISGVIEVDPAKIHVENRESQEATNDGLKREWNNHRDFMNLVLDKQPDKLDQAIHFDHDMWNPQRVGIKTTYINPQSSKVQRPQYFQKSWKSEVDINDELSLQSFLLRVGEGFGVKTERAFVEKSMPKIQALMGNLDIQNAVDVLVGVLHQDKKLTEADEALLVKGAKRGRENFHSMDGLIALAHYKNALAEGKTTFTTTMFAEFDGLNNGPILAHALFGAGWDAKSLNATMAMGGIYTVDSGTKDFLEYRSAPGAQDLYESTTGNALKKMREGTAEATNPYLMEMLPQWQEAVFTFTGSLGEGNEITSDGRKIIKSPVTKLVYGQGMTTSIMGMSTEFLGSINTAIQKLAAGESGYTRGQIIDRLNLLIESGNYDKEGVNKQVRNPGARIDASTSVQGLLDIKLTSNQKKALQRAFINTLGYNVRAAVQENFAVMLEARKSFTEAAGLAYGIYEAVYQAKRAEMVEGLIRKGLIPLVKGLPIHDLSQAQEDQLKEQIREMLPMMHSAMSAMDGNLEAGYKGHKMTTTMSSKGAYSSSVSFDTGYTGKNEEFKGRDANGNLSGAKSVGTGSDEQSMTSPGVSLLPISTHGVDSAISHLTQLMNEMLNVHDAGITGLGTMHKASRDMNENTFKVLRDYSPMMEMHAMLSRTLTGLANFSRSELPSSAIKGIEKALAAYLESAASGVEDPETKQLLLNRNLMEVVGDFKANAANAERVKLEAMKEWGYVGQYAKERGSYEVKPEDRDGVEVMLANVNGTLAQDEKDALQFIMERFEFRKQAMAKVALDQKAKEDAAHAAMENALVLDIPNVQAMTLLASIVKDESLAQNARDQAEAVMNKLMPYTDGRLQNAPQPKNAEGNTPEPSSLRVAVLKALKPMDAAAMTELLSSRFSTMNKNPWGDLGTPVFQGHDPAMVAALEGAENQELGSAAAIELVKTLLAGRATLTPTEKVWLAMLPKIESLLPAGLVVRLISKNTPADRAVKADVENSRGWYANKQGEVIHLLGLDYKHAYLTPEILLHELYHAAIGAVIYDTRDIPKAVKEQQADAGRLKEVKKLVDELENLLSTVRNFVKTLPVAKQTAFAPALTNVDEFISWGMTNRDFQQEVLNNAKLKYKDTRKANAFRTLFKDFIGILSKLLFGDKANAKVTDALTVLIGNVSGLLAYAESEKARLAKDTDQTAAPARDMNMSMANPQHPVHSHTTQSMFEALADPAFPVSAEFTEHLQELLSGIVNKLHGPFGSFKEALMKDQPLTADGVFQKAQATGIAPFASLLLGAGFNFSQQEAFVAEQVEATVRAALDGNESETHAIYTALSKLFDEQAERLTAKDFFKGDWAQATADEVKQAQKLRDFMFKVNPSNGGRNDYLSRFAALGLSHEGFNQLLQVPTKVGDKILKDNHPAGILTRLFQRILVWLNGKTTNTFEGQAGNAKLLALVDQLAGIEAKKKRRLANPGKNAMSPVDDKLKAGAEFAKTKLIAFGGSDFFRKSKSGYLKGAGAVIRIVGAEERVGKMMEGMVEIYDKEVKGKHGFTLSLLQELMGQNPVWEKLMSYAKNLERIRKHVITQTSKGVLGSFANNGKDMDKDTRKAVTNAFIRTGAHVLLDHYDTQQMELLLKSPQALSAEIAVFEAQLTGFSPKVQNYYLNQSKVLAYQLVSGRVVDEHLMHNAGNIAKLLGTAYQGRLTEAQTTAAEATIDVLVSLYAMSYLDSQDKVGAIKVLKAENARAEGNGVHMVMLQHRALEQKARETIFKDSEVLMQKGYTAEIYNPYIDVQVVSSQRNMKNGVEQSSERYELEQRGYVLVEDLSQDPSDQDTVGKTMYLLLDGGKMPYQSGFTSLTGMRQKGSAQHSGSTDLSTREGLYAFKAQKRLLQEKQAGIAAMFDRRPGFDPRTVQETFLAPVLNARGDSVNYAYLMQASTKDLVLQRNNDFSTVLGAQAGSVFDKESSAKQNRQVVQALKDHADLDYAENSHAYERVGPKSTDPEMLEIYKMFPESMKRDIREIWGQEGMLVRKDTMRIAFGYRKFSAADVFETEWGQRNWAEKIFADTVEYMMYSYARGRGMSHAEAEQFKKYSALQVRKGERMWQGMVQAAKDNIVVKTGTVLYNNVADNLSLLYVSGVPIRSVLKYHGVATQAILAYERDSNELFQLQMQIVPGSTAKDIPGLQEKIAKLENAIARNPVKPLVDAGLMPSIIEDVSQDDDGYGYQSQFNRWVEGKTAKLNPKVLAVGKQLYMAHDTTTYKSLSQVTKMSDFVARYTLYQHLIERKTNPLSHEEAIQQAKDSFIDYDVPLHSGLQYTEDMGITMFTKYFLRIQRVLYKQVRENPSRVLANVMVSNYLDWVPSVMDASVWHHLGNNPIKSGPWQFFGSVTDIASAKLGLSLVP